MSLKQQRLWCIQEIIQQDSGRFGLLHYEPFVSYIGANYIQYPNQFLHQLLRSMKKLQSFEYYDELMKDHQVFGSKYRQFINQYTQCYRNVCCSTKTTTIPTKTVGTNYELLWPTATKLPAPRIWNQKPADCSNYNLRSATPNFPKALQKLSAKKRGISTKLQKQCQSSSTKTFQQPKKSKICCRKNETLQAKMIQKQIKDRARQDFDTIMKKQNETLYQLQINTKQIIYKLNLLTPQNIKEIQKDLLKYLYHDQTVCQILIEKIIQKALDQQKYASTYAKLCLQFSQQPAIKFQFDSNKNKKKKHNPFKVFLISRVQHSFDKKFKVIPEFANQEQKDLFLKGTKKKILGNVKFIAELIRSKILKKIILKVCISSLISTFLAKYYYYRKTEKIIDSYYDYYFQALIEFIETIGEFYEKMDETTKQKQQPTLPYAPAEKKIINLIQMNDKPPERQIQEISNLKADDYFNILQIINTKVLKLKNKRLSALLLNLVERRANKWQKICCQIQFNKPQKLKDDISGMEYLNGLVKNMFKDWESDSKNEKIHFKDILNQYTEAQFLTECLNQLADQKKQNVRKRVDLFDIIFDTYFNLNHLKHAWIECIKFMAFNSGDFPFCGAALALVLKKILTREPSKLQQFYVKTEDEDQQFFLNQVFGKLYHYTRLQEIKKLTEPSKKYSNMLYV